MTEHEVRTERILLEILHLCYVYIGMTAHSTANPLLMKELKNDAIGIYLKLFAELSNQVLKENPELYQKLLADYNC